MGQQPQFPPQEDFPCFLSLRSRTTISATTPISSRLTMIVPALSAIVRSIISHLFGYGLNDIWHFHIQPTGMLEIDYDEENNWGQLISMTAPDSMI